MTASRTRGSPTSISTSGSTTPRDQDLDISLIHDGVTVLVSRDNGGDGDDYGTGAGCDGTMTVFDDSATTAIS